MRRSCRRQRITGLWVLMACLAALAAPAPGQPSPKLSRSDLKTLQKSFAALADDVRPSVVAIRTYVGMRPFSQGSGVIIRPNGYILTNYHVVEKAPRIVVVLHNGMEHEAALMQVDDRSDLAVVKIEADRLRAARFGDLKNVRIGHWTFAVGNPFGLSNISGTTSFTVGNVSAIGRNLSRELDVSTGTRRYYGNLIETTAAINPGNSGGPLFNIDGEVIGIVSAIETRSGVNEGVGFAIPIADRTRTIIDKLLRGEEVRYGYLGVQITDPPAEKLHKVQGRQVRGALVVSVEPGPAERADLRKNDVIIELDGVAVESSDHLIRIVGGILPGDDVNIRYVRGNRKRHTRAVLEDRKTALRLADGRSVPTLQAINWRGAWFAEMPVSVRRDLDDQAVGLVVVDVRPGSDAAKRGLKPENVVVSVNGKPVRTLEEFRKARQVADETIRLRLDNRQEIRFPQG
ncbi:MAG: trypsin-like peptidase domain-containing protein [Phycisphaerae bacterium]